MKKTVSWMVFYFEQFGFAHTAPPLKASTINKNVNNMNV